jgi:putative nucleotidyltransferase with HDIG domain
VAAGWRTASSVVRALLMTLLGTLIVGATILVYLTGGARSPAVHALYLPILLGALFFNRAGGLTCAAAAAIAVGPWMPLDVGTGEAQTTLGWVLRGGAFLLIGGLAGQIQVLLSDRLVQVNRLVQKISQVHAKTLSTLASTVELRDEPTGGHCIRVAHNARAVAAAMGLDEQEQRIVYWAGLLHDLGKTAIPERILLKPERLTEDEWTEMRRHSIVGADLLGAVSPVFSPIAEGVRSHHERWDGRGYPDGLSGEEIPLVGRIVTVVDVFEALTCVRPYREPATAHEALGQLRTGAGNQFDPALVPIFEALYRKGQIHTATDPRSHLAAAEEPPAIPADESGSVKVIRRRPAARSVYHLGSSGRP